jgi:3-oxoacyl-[acyl-carrier protein] reductase
MSEKKTAIVTGAGKGIGRAIAARLYEVGYRVAAITRTESDLDQLREDLTPAAGEMLFVPGDVSDADTVAEFVSQVESEWKQVDLLVNNAGLGIMAPVHELEVRHWDRMMNANLRGTFLFTRAVVPGMIKRQEGTIINIASIAGKDGFAGGTGYAASKHAVMGFNDSLWREVREHNIRVCAICPGSVDTHFFGSGEGGAGREHMMRSDDVAEAVLYVARQPDRLFIKEIEMRVTHPRKG